jgi:hypothetical protein
MMAVDHSHIARITALAATIEKMTSAQHIEVLRIITSIDPIKINENRNGVYINMTMLSLDTVAALQKYSGYLADQEAILAPAEAVKTELCAAEPRFHCEPIGAV